MGAARNMTLKSATEASFTSASAEPSISHSVTISQSAMRFLSANAFFPSALSGYLFPEKSANRLPEAILLIAVVKLNFAALDGRKASQDQ